jgi:1-deoxy-D-xylulose-5-phosphate synthase
VTPRILRVGLPDRYVTHGKPALLHEEVGFTGERIAERVAAAISDGRRGRTIQGRGPRGSGSAIVGA